MCVGGISAAATPELAAGLHLFSEPQPRPPPPLGPGARWTSTGREFQSQGAIIEKVLSLILTSLGSSKPVAEHTLIMTCDLLDILVPDLYRL